MRVLVIAFTLLALAFAKPGADLPAFKVLQDRSLGAIPKIEITFPNGMVDNMVLERFYSNEAERQARSLMTCNYIGHLENEVTACVAVTGCLGKDDLEMTIMSKHAGASSMIILRKDNSVERVENPFNHPDVKSETLKAPKSAWHAANGDEMVNDADAALENYYAELCATGDCSALPATHVMELKFGYDDTFSASFSSVEELETYVIQMQAHIQAHMCHESLGTKIKLERVGDITHHVGETWRAESNSNSLQGPILDITENQPVEADLYVYLAKDPEFYGTIGLAWLGTLCKRNTDPGYQAGISEKRENVLATAQVVSHEMGHNMGLYHDFDNRHGGSSSPCNGEGLMSYGSVPDKWSECSRSDFLAHYNTIVDSNWWTWCMPEDNFACGGDGTPPPPPPTTTPAPTTPPPPPGTGCPALDATPSWYHDGYCDDELNTAACGYDGGDCCLKKSRKWNNYCTVCACLGQDCPQYNKRNFRNGKCHDEMNTAGCFYDGGDCCVQSGKWDSTCSVCQCLDPFDPAA